MFTKSWTDEEVEHALGLRRLGLAVKQIALKIGRTELAVFSKFTEISHNSAQPQVCRVTPEALAAREARRDGYDRRDLTATFCGDPPVGYSALDDRTRGRR
jgi:hypothetical protein